MIHRAEEITAAYQQHGSLRKAAAALGMGRTTYRERFHRAQVPTVPANIPAMEIAGADIFPHSRPRTVVCLYDVHAPFEDRRALDVALEHVHRRHTPTDLVLGGDFADLFEFSRFASTPRMHPDEEVYEVVNRLRDMKKALPGCQYKYLLGNHERRITRYIQNEAPKLARLWGATIPAIFRLEELGYQFHDNAESWETRMEFLKIGKLNYLHGDEIGGCGYKYAAQRMAELYRANIIYGHLHVTDGSKPMRDLDGHVVRTWQVGCLHTRTPGYRPGASHNLGFAVVEYDSGTSGHFTVFNYLLDDNYRVRL